MAFSEIGIGGTVVTARINTDQLKLVARAINNGLGADILNKEMGGEPQFTEEEVDELESLSACFAETAEKPGDPGDVHAFVI